MLFYARNMIQHIFKLRSLNVSFFFSFRLILILFAHDQMTSERNEENKIILSSFQFYFLEIEICFEANTNNLEKCFQ